MSSHQRILRGLSIGGIVIVIFILALLIISIFASVIFANNNKKRATTPLSQAQRVFLQFDYPQYLYLQEEPVDIRVNVWTNDSLPLSKPLTVSLNIPEGIQVVTSTLNANDRIVLLTFLPSNGAVQSEHVYLQNAGTVNASQAQEITVESSLNQDVLPMAVWLDSPLRSAFAGFFRNALSSNGPILLVVAAITAIMTGLLQYYGQQEELARAEAEELNQQKDVKARNLAENTRKYLIERNAQGIKRIWQELELPDMLGRLPANEQTWLKRLVSIAIENSYRERQAVEEYAEEIKNIQAEWPDETAGAILCAFTNGKEAVNEP